MLNLVVLVVEVGLRRVRVAVGVVYLRVHHARKRVDSSELAVDDQLVLQVGGRILLLVFGFDNCFILNLIFCPLVLLLSALVLVAVVVLLLPALEVRHVQRLSTRL